MSAGDEMVFVASSSAQKIVWLCEQITGLTVYNSMRQQYCPGTLEQQLANVLSQNQPPAAPQENQQAGRHQQAHAQV